MCLTCLPVILLIRLFASGGDNFRWSLFCPCVWGFYFVFLMVCLFWSYVITDLSVYTPRWSVVNIEVYATQSV